MFPSSSFSLPRSGLPPPCTPARCWRCPSGGSASGVRALGFGGSGDLRDSHIEGLRRCVVVAVSIDLRVLLSSYQHRSCRGSEDEGTLCSELLGSAEALAPPPSTIAPCLLVDPRKAERRIKGLTVDPLSRASSACF